MLLLILGLVLFIGLVVVHEFGHFIMARRGGVDVEEFGLGFPPRLWGRKTRGGWIFSINLLPVGGFVRMKGETDAASERGTFGAASLSTKTKIMAAGVVMNLVVAFLLLTALSWAGSPVLVCNQYHVASDTTYTSQGAKSVTVESVESGSPAARIGLQKGDEILAAGPDANALKPVTLECPLSDLTAKHAGEPLAIRYTHGNTVRTGSAVLLSKQEVDASLTTKNPKGYLGITTGGGLRFAHSTWSAPIVAAGQIAQFTALTFQGLGKAVAGLGGIIAGIFTGNGQARHNAQTAASSQVSGPVGVFFVLKGGASLGLKFILFITAIISLTLAIMNILPIPALDGGRLWLTLASHAVGRPLSEATEQVVSLVGFLLLGILMVLITVVDVKRFF